jgi:murein L,D-transpeptidase YafK
VNKLLFLLSALTLLGAVLLLTATPSPHMANTAKEYDSLIVQKSKKQLSCYYKRKLIKVYTCSTGSVAGHKQEQGDNRTPEGIYHITDRNANSDYYRNLHIDYPNATDRARCKKAGVKTGGDIKIHGYADSQGKTTDMNKRFSYTWGCVGVTNNDMAELFQKVKLGSPILIVP